MSKKKQGLLLSILGIIGLIVITVGVSYAFFNYARGGSTENTVTSGKITFLYTEVSKVGKGIKLENAYPISDELGKKQTGEGKVFDFKITSTTPNSIGIPYEVTVRKKEDSTLDEDVVKIYLTKVNGSLEEEVLLDNYNNLTQTSKVDSNKYNERVIYQGEVPSNTSNYEQDFRLRMWIDEDTDFSPVKDETGQAIYPYNHKTFTIMVNVYANGEITSVKEPVKIYGVKRSINTSSTSWERTDDSVGLVASAQIGTTPVQNDFDSIYPWSDIISYDYDTDTKQVTAYYGDSNFSFNPAGNVEVLTYIPEFYYKREQKDGYEYISISKDIQEGYIKSEAFSVGRYTMSGNSTRVHSKSGNSPLVNTTITDFRTYARNLGEGFGQLDYHYFILQLLYLVEYADYDSQAKLGQGYTMEGHTSSISSGGCDFLGMKSGSIDGSDNSSIIYRGVEDIFGNVWQFVDGINIRNNQVYICYESSQYQGDKYDECYQPIGYTNINQQGWISRLGYDPTNQLVALPIGVQTNQNNYLGDFFYNLNVEKKILLFGGAYGSGTPWSGLWLYSFDKLFMTYPSLGSRLIKTS